MWSGLIKISAKFHTYCKINITLYDYMLTECRAGKYNIKIHFYNHNHLLLFISCSYWDESQVTFTYWITKLKLMMGSIMPHTELCTLEWLWENRRVKKKKKTFTVHSSFKIMLKDKQGNTVMGNNLCLSQKAGLLDIKFAVNFEPFCSYNYSNALILYYCI